MNSERSGVLFVWVCGLGVTLALMGSGPVWGQKIDLAGTWRVALDVNDAGVDEEWFTRELTAPIELPGTLRDNGYGDPITAQTVWMSRLHDEYWYLRKDYLRYAEPPNVKIPFWLQPELKYTGVAWYQRQITIPPEWAGRRAVISFERAHWSTALWLDDEPIGFNDSLAAPHVYDLGIREPGTYTLSVRVDNRYLVNIRQDAHAITDSTQSNWHGLVGRLSLTSTTPIWIEDVRAYGDIERKSVRVVVDLGNATGFPGRGTLSVGEVSAPVEWDIDGGSGELEVPLGSDARLWDEFDPALHHLTVVLKGEQADDRRELTVGLRQIKSEDATFYVNGRKTFFRGTHEGCTFPLTGYPPTDVASWRKVLEVVKDYGLNHVRFHSWCPPEAAFVAADELGVYLQPECSNWGQYSSRDDTMKDFLCRETEQIVKAYGNHPSFVMLSSGNEPAGPWQGVLTPWLIEWKQRDDRRIYASQTGRYYGNEPGPVDNIDYLIAIRIGSYRFRGNQAWHNGDWRRSLEGTNYPVISHETGQWCAYPDLAEIDKYTGSLKPKNYEIFRDSLAAHGMLDQAHDFMMASGMWQVACYKQEIEALLRTPGMGGFQLLDLHDYPGQGTAVVGPLNVFWESKGYVSAEQFRRFCSETVPLARLDKRVYTSDETLTVKIEMAHFGRNALQDVVPTVKIVDARGNVEIATDLPRTDIGLGTAIDVGEFSLSLATFEAPQKYRLIVGLKGHDEIENDWEFWVYPSRLPSTPRAVVVTDSFAQAEARLRAGDSVLFLPSYNDLGWESPPIGPTPIFWNRLMGPGWDRFLGVLVDPNQPALAHFPTDYYYDWQWEDIIRPACRAMNMDSLPSEVRPMIQVIDDWNRNYKLALAFECRVGAGKLVICSADIESDLDNRPSARQLRHSLLEYMAGVAFDPSVELTAQQIEGMLFDNQIMQRLGATVVDGGASAANAIDGNPNTFWAAGQQGGVHPYDLTIRLAQPTAIAGIICMNRQNQRNHYGDARRYVVEVSGDGIQWQLAGAGQLESTFEPQRIFFGKILFYRYLRLRILSGFGPDQTCALAELAVIRPEEAGRTGSSPARPYVPVPTETQEIEGPSI